MNRRASIAASRAEARRLGAQSVAEVTPSRRDFSQYVATQREGLAVIARIVADAAAARVAQARAYDDSEVAALLVTALDDGVSAHDVRAISAAVTAPLLRDVGVFAANQIYYARLMGADAVVLSLEDDGAERVPELARIAGSLHLAVVAEVASAGDLDTALQLPHALIGLNCLTPGGELSVPETLALAAQIPRQRTVIALAEVTSCDAADELRGKVDAVVLAELLRSSSDLDALIERVAQGDTR